MAEIYRHCAGGVRKISYWTYKDPCRRAAFDHQAGVHRSPPFDSKVRLATKYVYACAPTINAFLGPRLTIAPTA